MKRLMNFISLAVIVVSLAGLAWLYSPVGPAGAASTSHFAVNDSRTVRFRVDAETVENLSDVDLEDQLRDWLLYSVLYDTGLNEESLRKALYDLPPTRAQYVKPVAAFQYGPARFRVINGARVTIALIPQGAPNRRDLLAQVADSVRSSTGDKPSALRVFEYRIDPIEMTAEVSRKSDIPGSEIFSASYGYVEKEVRSSAELGDFLDAIDDVVWASSSGGSLALGGRTLVRKTGAHKLRVEDVAVLWQSENQLLEDRKRIEAFDAKWKNRDYLDSLVRPQYEKELNAIKAKYPEQTPDIQRPGQRPGGDALNLFDNSSDLTVLSKEYQRYLTPSQRRAAERLRRQYDQGHSILDNPLSPQPQWLSPSVSPSLQKEVDAFKAKWQNREYVESLIQPIYDRELAALRKTLSSKGSEGIPKGSGFSLDPTWDYAKLSDVFGALRPALEKLAGPEKTAAAGRGIAAKDEGLFLQLLFELEEQGGENEAFTKLAQAFIKRAQFQHARYDGHLSGTEVGMVLFYTDLLAKLWALDYLESAPDKADRATQVRGFVPLLKVSVSPIFEKERRRLSDTRLWFGPRDSAFSKTAGGLFFAPIATRVYAASSNMLQPGKEAEPNAASAAFLGWWNDHYAAVADFEPEYHRLNQIMKWSVVIGWLSGKQELEHAGFLRQTTVRHDHWFPVWAEQNLPLRFREWGPGRVSFFAKGYQGVETESMPILVSRSYVNGSSARRLSGGVSLGDSAGIRGRPELPRHVEPLLSRANVVEAEGSVAGRRSFRSLDNTSYTFPEAQAGRAAALVEAKAPGKLRGHDMELKPAGVFETSFNRGENTLKVRMGVGSSPIGELSIERRAGTRQVDLLYSRLAIEYARSYSKTLEAASRAGEKLLSALAGRADVKRAIEFNGVFYVEPRRAAGQWLKVVRTDPEMNISNGDVRFASLDSGGGHPTQWNIIFLDRQQVDVELPAKGMLLVEETPPAPSGGVGYLVRNRGPPPPPPEAKVIDLDSFPPDQGGILAAAGGGGGKERGGRGFGAGGSDGGAEALAREAAKDPDHVLLLVARKKQASFEHVDRLAKKGNFEGARVELDAMAELYPDDPDVVVRRVVAHAALGSRTAGAVASRTSLPGEYVPKLLDIADAAMEHLSGPAAQQARQTLDAVVRGCIGKAQGRRIHFVDGGIEMQLPTMVREADTPGQDRASVRYTLASLDFNAELGAPPMPPPSEPISGKFRDSAVTLLHPEYITDAATGTRYRRMDDGTTSQVEGKFSFRSAYASAGGDDCSSLSDGKRRKECREDRGVYEIEAGTSADRAANDRRP